MITSLKFKNCYSFENENIINFIADLRTKKMGFNYHSIGKYNILKSIILYGGNNTGKTNVVYILKELKNILLNKGNSLMSNFLNKNNEVVEISINLIYEEEEYSYEFKYDTEQKVFIYEKFTHIIINGSNVKDDVFFERNINISKDFKNNIISYSKDKELEKVIHLASNSNLLIYSLQVEEFKILQKVKKILINLANKIEIIDMNNLKFNKTIESLKLKNKRSEKIKEFIKRADLYLDDFEYKDKTIDLIETEDSINKDLIEELKLYSKYKDIEVPSIIFDSVGTKKFLALAGYIFEAFEEGKILIIDELDSSLYFKLTKAIISLFHNIINTKAQILVTTHDISLLDCRKLFRKEQIYFTVKNKKENKLVSLSEFTYSKTGIRDTTDLIDKYIKGNIVDIPNPNLINVFLAEEESEYETD